MTASELLSEAARLGIELRIEGGQLRYRPKSAMTPDLAEQLRTHEPAIRDYLASAGPGEWDRAEGDCLVAEMIQRLNAGWPADHRPTEDDWQRLDQIESGIVAAREQHDLVALRGGIAAYESAVRSIRIRMIPLKPQTDDRESPSGDLPDGHGPSSLPWCPGYRHPKAWRSIYGKHLICGTCHPPTVPGAVAEWIHEPQQLESNASHTPERCNNHDE